MLWCSTRSTLIAASRFYSLQIERDLFGTIRLVRSWGRIGINGQELVKVIATELEAGVARGPRPRETPRGNRDL
jgi:predicted DNA-binding WGR domain protein